MLYNGRMNEETGTTKQETYPFLIDAAIPSLEQLRDACMSNGVHIGPIGRIGFAHINLPDGSSKPVIAVQAELYMPIAPISEPGDAQENGGVINSVDKHEVAINLSQETLGALRNMIMSLASSIRASKD
jgi:hypothetical protein